MSERKKRKDDTWTKEELNSALKHKDERREKRDRLKYDQVDAAHSSTDRRKSEGRKSAATEKRYSCTGDDRKSSLSSVDKRESESKHRDRRSRDDDEKRERDRRKKEERREREIAEREREEKSKRRSERRHEEDHERKERKSRHDKEERRSRRREDEELEKELRKYEKEERRHREEGRRSGKRESAHIMEEESSRSKEERRREREERKQAKEERRREKEKKAEKEERRREKYETRRREEEKQLEAEQKRSTERSIHEKHRNSRTSVEESTSSKDLRRRGFDGEKPSSHSDVGNSSYRESSSRSVSKSLSVENANNSAEEEDAYNYDDDEFEDYEDDFEDEDIESPERPPDVQDIINAMKQENERVQSARTQSPMSDKGYLSPAPDDDFLPAPPIGMTSVNFVAAKRSKAGSKVAKRMMKRRDDLITLIQLDVVSFDMFDLPPVTEYNFYIKNFGSQNTRQLSTQCNDDALTSETQTETPDSVEKWTQHPQDGAVACGGSRIDENSNPAESLLALMRGDSQRFVVFLNYASNLVETSFAEERYWSGSGKEKSILSCCDSFTKFNTNLSYLQGRHILHTVFGEGGMMAIAFGMSTHKVAARLDKKGLITVWKGSNTEQPDKILVCDALPVTCCFAPKKKNLLFVGVDDGNVLVYDLGESSTMHQNKEIEKNKMSVLRTPTYMTGCQNDVHICPIVCINLMGTFQSSNQVFSLDESARICIWTVVDIFSNLDDDMGLAPMGRVKLVKTNPIDLVSKKSSFNQDLGVRATCAVCPDASVFYVGLESGSVMSLTRDRKLKCYRSHSIGDVTSISVSSLNMMLMLVSYGDGTLALFQVKQETPVMTWSLGDCVLFCDWSNCRSSVFFALDSTNHLHVWDLMAMDSGPVVSDLFQHKTLRFCVDGFAKKTTDLMVAYDSCAFEVHRISPHFTDSVTSDESDHMVSLLLSLG